MAFLLKELRAHLITEGIVRDPQTPGADPPMWCDPRDGVPAPGEGDNATERGTDAVLAAFVTGGIAARPRENELRKDIVDIWIRVASAHRAYELEDQLRLALIDKVNWQMGAMGITETLQWRPLQRLDSGPQGFTFITAYVFERRAF